MAARPKPDAPDTSAATDAEAPDDALRWLTDAAELPPVEAPQRLTFPSGRTAVMEPAHPERLMVFNPEGDLELSIRFTENGPVLGLVARALQLETPGDVEIRCDHFRVQARSGVEIASGGDLRQTAEGALHTRVEGEAKVQAQSIDVRARGPVSIESDEEMFLNGKELHLNS